MDRPSVEDLAPAQMRAALEIAERLASAGHGSWIVGGAARDLALGRRPKDLDMVTTATPDEIESLFEHTVGVGKAFGIMLLPREELDVELATLRLESGYSDGRRPDEVRFAGTVQEDAARRDFTCNALYLDPRSDEWIDPTGGLEDLSSGVLRTVGDPARRFGEDGLRLLRMARFQAGLGLELAPDLARAASAELDALRGVSPERVREELGRVFEGPRAVLAFETLSTTGILHAALPAWAATEPLAYEQRREALERLPDPPGQVAGLAWLLEPDPLATRQDLERDLDLIDALRPARTLRTSVERAWRVRRALPRVADGAPRARLLRDPGWEEGCNLALAWSGNSAGTSRRIEQLRRWREGAPRSELFPAALLRADDLSAAGVPRGPAWGKLLRAAEDEQLEGRLGDRAQALEWLAGREDPA